MNLSLTFQSSTKARALMQPGSPQLPDCCPACNGRVSSGSEPQTLQTSSRTAVHPHLDVWGRGDPGIVEVPLLVDTAGRRQDQYYRAVVVKLSAGVLTRWIYSLRLLMSLTYPALKSLQLVQVPGKSINEDQMLSRSHLLKIFHHEGQDVLPTHELLVFGLPALLRAEGTLSLSLS